MAKGKPTRLRTTDMVEDKKFQARDDLHTLTRAQEIEQDRERFKAARVTGKEQMRSLERVIKRAK
jgi:hypothetical protein